MVPLSLVKAQLRLEPEYIDEDEILNLYISAAFTSIEAFLCRKLYVDVVPESDESGMLFNSDIQLASLLMIDHWYNNRSSTTTETVKEVPLGFRHLLGHYRYRKVG
ncbi:head-tail connector protein [Motilimonas cestriensis]|uniref:Head-tail connector protein n=1 Tax=Motilimonas cestriensis TaxID=2742685 RepID=A0ABS8WFD4_9GAMM|nr:head-tail connector protein [Motilimonas cestriensis]MCE2597205.1 head-tail connector protein [Motilimonas cestriensis]